MKKKVLSLLLVLCMIFTMLPAAALAENETNEPPVVANGAQSEQDDTDTQNTPDINNPANGGSTQGQTGENKQDATNPAAQQTQDNNDESKDAQDNGTSPASEETKAARVATTALPEAKNGVITLIEDVALSQKYIVAQGQAITLDLAGYTITAPTSSEAIEVAYGGTLTIQDNGTNGAIKRDGTESKYVVVNYGTLTLAGGAIKSNGVSSSALANRSTKAGQAVMNITGGEVNAKYIAIKNDCLSGANLPKLTVNGGILAAGNDQVIQNWGIAEIKGGTFSGCVGTWTNPESGEIGQTTITGGSFNLENSAVEPNAVLALFLYQGITNGGGAKLTVSGDVNVNGSLNGKTIPMVAVAKMVSGGNQTQDTKPEGVTLTVSEGTYNAPIAKQYLAEGKGYYPNEAGQYVVQDAQPVASFNNTNYDTLAEAVAAALATQDSAEVTVTLLQNATGGGIKIPASAHKTITIDFGGYTYTCADPAAGSTGTESQGFHLEKDNTVTLKNGTINVAQGVNDTRTLIQNYSNLILENITLDGTNLHAGSYRGVVFPPNATFTLNSYNGTVNMTNTTIKKATTAAGSCYAIGCGWWPGTSKNWYPAGTQITASPGCTFDNVLIYRDDANQTAGNANAKSSITVGGTPYYGTYTDADSPYYVEYTSQAGALVPVLPEATVHYSALADTSIVLDCADKTMYVQFANPLPGNTWLWFDIQTPDKQTTYGIAAQANAAGATTKFAWSFLNDGQFEAWPDGVTPGEIATGEYTVTCYVLSGNVSGKVTKPADAVKVWQKTVTVSDLVPASAAPDVKLDPKLESLNPAQKTAVTAAAGNVALEAEDMAALAQQAVETASSAPDSLPTTEQATTALTTAGVTVAADAKIMLVVQAYMDVQVTAYTPADGDTPATLTYDITPMYRIVATTATNPDDIKLSADGGVPINAVPIGNAQELDVRTPVQVTVGLPTDFVAANKDGSYPSVYVQHKNHEYTATVAENGTDPDTYLTATFTNPHGFSEFTITANPTAVAKIDEDAYTTLQDAVDAVANGGTITLLKSGLSATVNDAKTFTITTAADVEQPTITVSNSNLQLKITDADGGGKTYTVTQKTTPSQPTTPDTPGYDGGYDGGYDSGSDSTSGGSSSGSGGGGGGIAGGGYAITAPSSINGGSVRVSPSVASQGSVVTITAIPDKGYELAHLSVTDASGKRVPTTDAGNNKYTFTMPASRVSIDAAFIASSNRVSFVDVPPSASYYDAVAWAVAQKITSGTSATTFSPDASCTRAQMVTFLWNAAGSPAPQGIANPFDDVHADSYYYNAVLWAVEQKITAGTGEATFSPDATVTRGQVVAFLHNAAGNPTVAGSHSFTDVASDAYYANAVNWAVSKGITVGTSAETFSPDNDCTRAQIVVFLYRDRVH